MEKNNKKPAKKQKAAAIAAATACFIITHQPLAGLNTKNREVSYI